LRLAVIAGFAMVAGAVGPSAYAQTIGTVTEQVSELEQEVSQATSAGTSATSDIVSETSGTISKTTDSISGTISKTTESASGTISKTTSPTSGTVSGASEGGSNAVGSKSGGTGNASSGGPRESKERSNIVDTRAEAARDRRLLAMRIATLKERTHRNGSGPGAGPVLGSRTPALGDPPPVPSAILPPVPDPGTSLSILVVLGLIGLLLVGAAYPYAMHAVSGSWNPLTAFRRRYLP
jgi:hypothetical protein